MAPPDWRDQIWLTCSMCGTRYRVECAWWASVVAAGNGIKQCRACAPALHGLRLEAPRG